jgi:putative transposase
MSAAAEWFPAAALAGLPGLPGSKRAVIEKAATEQWPFRQVAGRGGQRREYHISALPAQTRAALTWNKSQVVAGGESQAGQLGQVAGATAALQQELRELAVSTVQSESLKASAAMAPNDQRRMDAKLEVLRAFEFFQQAAGLPTTLAEHQFASAYRLGSVQIPAWVREQIAAVSPASIQRWRLAVKARGITALAGAYGNRKGASKVSAQQPLREFVTAMLVNFPHSRATQVMQAVKARLAADIDAGEIQLPSIKSLERWIGQWRQENKQTLSALENPDAWKNKYMVAYGSQSESITRLNQRWELDSSPADVMFIDGRHSLIGTIDVGGRRPKLLVSKTSKATAVAQLMRQAMLDWGVPEEVKTDNGADYKSKHIARVVAGLDIKQTFCPPFQPWHKPHIERFFGSFTRGLVELLDGFIGHNVAERSAIEARKSFADRLMKRGEVVEITMTAADFQDFCNRWIDDVYMHNPHQGLGGLSPFQVVAASRDPIRTITDERVLDVMLAEAAGSDGGFLTVQKQGIKSDRAWFIAPELEAYTGERVQCLQLPDLGRMAVYAGNGAFICIAECPERTGMDRKVVAAKGRELQKKRVQEERRALKAAAKRVGTDDIVDEILRHNAQQAGKLVALPKPKVEHTSAGLAAAADTVAELHREQSTSADLLRMEGVADSWKRLQAEALPAANDNDNELARRRGPVAQPVFETPHERVQWLARQGKTRALTAEEQDYLARFKKEHAGSYRRIVSLVDEQFDQRQEETPDTESGAGAV